MRAPTPPLMATTRGWPIGWHSLAMLAAAAALPAAPAAGAVAGRRISDREPSELSGRASMGSSIVSSKSSSS